VASKSFSYWSNYYADQGIKLKTLQMELNTLKEQNGIENYGDISASLLVRRSYEVYLYLKATQHEFDIIHLPDFEGVGYYSFIAKHQRLAFQNSQLIVGLHGPTRWIAQENFGHFHVNSDPTTILEVDFIEQKSIELADALWSPSKHLLDWVSAQNWVLPSKIFLLPLLPGIEVKAITASEENFIAADGTQIKEIVFFGRLEKRKGIEIFCNALDQLATRSTLPKELLVTFLGRSISHDNLNTIDYVKQRSKKWPFDVRFYDRFNRRTALDYLRQGQRLAVSIILSTSYYLIHISFSLCIYR
jgi:glycosyltransferase involved in cell wall biosynthesis